MPDARRRTGRVNHVAPNTIGMGGADGITLPSKLTGRRRGLPGGVPGVMPLA